MGKWYRATVIAVDERPNMVSVLYPDYGTEEYVHMRDIRKKIEFQDIAVNVIECNLYNVKPPNTPKGYDGVWPKEIMDKIHNIIVDVCDRSFRFYSFSGIISKYFLFLNF